MILAMSETLMINVVTAVTALVGTMFSGVMAYLMARLNVKADTAAKDTKEVKDTLTARDSVSALKLDSLAHVAEATHTLVNHNMMLQLKDNAELKRWKANMTGDPADVKAAELAERMLSDHKVKQENVDKKEEKHTGKEKASP